MAIAHDVTSFASASDVAAVNSGAPDTNAIGGDIVLQSTASATRCGFIKIQIPAKDTLPVSDKAFLHKVRLRLDFSAANTNLIFVFPLSASFASSVDYEELTYSTPNREGDASNIKWNPANPAHIDPAHTVPICVDGMRFENAITSSTGVQNFDITRDDIKRMGYDFGQTIHVVVYQDASGSTDTIDVSDSSIQIITQEADPEPATLSSAITADGLSANLTVTLPNDNSIDKYYLESAASAGISATASEDFGQATPNLGSTEIVPMSSVATLTQGANKFVRVFTENDEHVDTAAIAGNEIALFRPAINAAVLYSDSALSSALAATKENITLGQKVYLKVTNVAVSAAFTGNKYTKIRVNWDSGTSDTDEDYAVYDMQDLSPVLDNASNVVVSHIYHKAGAKVVKVQVEDENGFRSDKGNITGEQPDVKVGFPTAIISPSSTKITQAKYGDRTTAVTLSGQQSRTSGSDKIIEHYGWGYVPSSIDNTICTSNALDNDNSVFDNGSKQVKIGAISYLDNDDTVFKIFGLASFKSDGVGVSDTDNTHFDHYAYTSATASPLAFDIDARPNIGAVAVDTAGNGVFFKEIECVVCITKASNENNSIYSCARYILVTDESPNQNINTNLFYGSNVNASLLTTDTTVNETFTDVDEVLTHATLDDSLVVSSDIIKVDSEDMFIHYENGNDWLVVRGYNNSTAAAHSAGTEVLEYRLANRYKWGGYAKVRGSNIDFSAAGQIAITGGFDSLSSSSNQACWMDNGFYVGDIIKVATASSANGTYTSPKYYKIESFTADGDFYPKINIETDASNLTAKERTYISTTMTADTSQTDISIIRYDSTSKPSITAAVYNGAGHDDSVTFYMSVFDNSNTRFAATNKASTSNNKALGFHWSEDTVDVRAVAPETLDLDTLADASNIAIEKVNITRSGGITAQMPLGIRRYPVGVTRTKLGVPKVAVQAKALDQTGYRALFSLIEGNRYDYVFLDSKKLDSPTTSYRTLRMRLESGNLTKDTVDPNVYLANLNFVILGEDVT